MLVYFDDKTKLVFEEFLDDEDILTSTFDRWIAEHEELNRLYKHILRRLAIRRETGMLQRSISEKSGMYVQHCYDKKWDTANKYWSDLRKAEKEEEKADTHVYLHDLREKEDK
jgi:phage head maturation protease